jgi:ferredoxin
MDCCRTARRLGGEDVKVIVRSPFASMKASPWEKEDAQHEDIPIIDNHVPKAFVFEYIDDDGNSMSSPPYEGGVAVPAASDGTDGVVFTSPDTLDEAQHSTNNHPVTEAATPLLRKEGSKTRLVGMTFEKVEAVFDEAGKRSLVPTGEPEVFFPADDVLIAVGQENSFPWIERTVGVDFDKWELPVVDNTTFKSTNPRVFFGGDAEFGPENVITAVAHGHQAAVSIDLFCNGKNLLTERLHPMTNLISQKMGIHEWAYDSPIDEYDRLVVPQADKSVTLRDRKKEVELGFDPLAGYEEAKRCLNCDVQTVFEAPKCIECDACVDICPTACITFTTDGDESDLRSRTKVPALNISQDIYVADGLKTGRVMVKDEDVCLHCGLCAERCPTAAWDMQKFWYNVTKAGEIKYGATSGGTFVQIERSRVT